MNIYRFFVKLADGASPLPTESMELDLLDETDSRVPVEAVDELLFEGVGLGLVDIEQHQVRYISMTKSNMIIKLILTEPEEDPFRI